MKLQIHEPDENLQLTISGSSDVNPTAPDQLIVTVKANDSTLTIYIILL